MLTFTAGAATDTYTREDLCGGVANSTGFINPGLFHTAKMTGLAPDTQYFYSYGSPVRACLSSMQHQLHGAHATCDLKINQLCASFPQEADLAVMCAARTAMHTSSEAAGHTLTGFTGFCRLSTKNMVVKSVVACCHLS
jgi:hypothetical protein